MARGVNKVILIGRLGQDPESRFSADGTQVANFSLATSEVWKDKLGEKQEKTEWHRCVAWRKTAELIVQYTQKGSMLYVEGKLQTRSWDDKDGVKRYTTEIVINTIEFLSSKDDAGGSGGSQQGPQGGEYELPPSTSGDEDDLPF